MYHRSNTLVGFGVGSVRVWEIQRLHLSHPVYADGSTREGVNGTRWVLHAPMLSGAYRTSHQSSKIGQQLVSELLETSGELAVAI